MNGVALRADTETLETDRKPQREELGRDGPGTWRYEGAHERRAVGPPRHDDPPRPAGGIHQVGIAAGTDHVDTRVGGRDELARVADREPEQVRDTVLADAQAERHGVAAPERRRDQRRGRGAEQHEQQPRIRGAQGRGRRTRP